MARNSLQLGSCVPVALFLELERRNCSTGVLIPHSLRGFPWLVLLAVDGQEPGTPQLLSASPLVCWLSQVTGVSALRPEISRQHTPNRSVTRTSSLSGVSCRLGLQYLDVGYRGVELQRLQINKKGGVAVTRRNNSASLLQYMRLLLHRKRPLSGLSAWRLNCCQFHKRPS